MALASLRTLFALALLCGLQAGCDQKPTALRLLVYFDASLDVRQVGVQVSFYDPSKPTMASTSVFPSRPGARLSQGASVGVIFKDGDAGQPVQLVVSALGPGFETLDERTLLLVSPAGGSLIDEAVGFGSNPPIPAKLRGGVGTLLVELDDPSGEVGGEPALIEVPERPQGAQ